MIQLTKIKPPDFSSIATDFSSIATQFDPSKLSAIASNLSFPTDLLPTNFDALTGVVGSFQGMVQNLPTSLDDLLGDLLVELKGLSGGSATIGQLFGGLITPFTSANSVFSEFQSVVTPLTTDLLPALLNLQKQPVDAAALAQLLPISTLTTPLTTQLPKLLEPQLNQVIEVRSQITALASITQSPLTELQTLLDQVAALPLDPSLKAEQLPVLNEQRITQLKTRIDQVQQGNVKATTEKLQQLQQSLQAVPTALNASLDKALQQLSPHQLAQKSNFLDSASSSLERLGSVDLGGVISKMQGVIQPLQTLLDQGIETASAGVDTVVQTVNKAIATADQALIKVSALVTNVIDQLIRFIQQLDLTSLINQAKDVFQSLMLKLNGVLNQVSKVMDDIYLFVRGLVDKVLALGDQLPPLAEQFRQLLAQITTLLENPQFKDAVQQAKQGIALVVEKLDAVSLEPVFDQVLAQVDNVKTSLQSIDLSQLNQLLKAALSAALDLVKGAIDPPSQVTDLVKEQYKTLVSDPIIGGIVQPVKQQIESVVNLVHTLEPGTLVGGLLTPLYEQLIAAVKQFVEPNQVTSLLKPLSDFQTNLLKQIDAVLNPQKLLAPLMDLYQQIMGFVRSLTPEQILAPINDLLKQATQPLEQLGLDQIVTTIESSVQNVKTWINSIEIDDQLLDKGLEPLILGWIQKLKGVVNQLDLSGVTRLLKPLQTAATTLIAQTRLEGNGSLEVVQQIQQMGVDVQQFTRRYGEQMGTLAQTWQQQRTRLEGFTPSANLVPQYAALKTQLQLLNPISLLAAMTQTIDLLGDTATALLETLTTIWKGLGDRLKQYRAFLDNLVSDNADGLKSYVNQAIDALVERILKPLIQTLNQPLLQLKEVVRSVRQLKEPLLKGIDLIPQTVRTLKGAIDTIIGKIRGFNFNFLIEPLGRVKDEIVNPLTALNPEPVLIVPLTHIYNKALKMLENLNPVHLFATPRGILKLKSVQSFTAKLGTQLEATTPLGETVWFETLVECEVPANGEVDVSVRALVAGRSSDIVGVEGVTWQVTDQADLQVIQTQPILSLVTLVQEELLGILKVFDPVELIAKPLNEQYKKIVELFDEIGIANLFDGFLKKIESIDREIGAGLGQVGSAFGGLVAAMPL